MQYFKLYEQLSILYRGIGSRNEPQLHFNKLEIEHNIIFYYIWIEKFFLFSLVYKIISRCLNSMTNSILKSEI